MTTTKPRRFYLTIAGVLWSMSRQEMEDYLAYEGEASLKGVRQIRSARGVLKDSNGSLWTPRDDIFLFDEDRIETKDDWRVHRERLEEFCNRASRKVERESVRCYGA